MVKNYPIIRRKKLIEVSIPLDAINEFSAKEKNIRHGHPSTLHLWWSRKPLATARSILFCQLVDDPSSILEEFPSKETQQEERNRLFRLVNELVKWENTENKELINQAQNEIKKSWLRCCSDNSNHPESERLFNPNSLPSFHDPFSGGGGIPLEAQRLGLTSYASDLNPVAVLITKAMIEIPQRFKNTPPVSQKNNNIEFLKNNFVSEGLAKDLSYYGKWISNQAKKRIGHLYPKIKITSEITSERDDLKIYEGQELTVISWIWVRTVKSINPSFSSVYVPLTSSFILSKKAGKEAYVHPIIEKEGYKFFVKSGKPSFDESQKRGTQSGKGGSNFLCLMSGTPIPFEYIRNEAKAGRMQSRMMAIVAETNNGRIYISPTPEMEAAAKISYSGDLPETALPDKALGFRVQEYGMKKWRDLFTERQLTALSTFKDLTNEVEELVEKDAILKGMKADKTPLNKGGSGAFAYAEAIKTYLAIGINRLADRSSSICSWDKGYTKIRNTFGRHALPMTWDFAEANVFSSSTGNYLSLLDWVIKFLLKVAETKEGFSVQSDASTQSISNEKIISTDPPYYDNIGYADLSDFFYFWFRQSLQINFPQLFSTITVPKSNELVATPFRHGDKKNAETFFLEGMKEAMKKISSQAHPGFPITIYYAFKQSEKKTNEKGSASTGWDTFLTAVLSSGLNITGTWPIRTELTNRMIGTGNNALSSSIVLVCEKKKENLKNFTRQEFKLKLREELPKCIEEFEKTNIAPVDIAQAAIGPGISIYSKAKAILNPDDSKMSVREALIEINSALDEYLSKDDLELDIDTRFALTFFESFGYSERPFGDAEGLAKARNVSVEGIVKAGILKSVGGNVNLIKRENLLQDWDPLKDDRLCVWEATQYLIRTLETEGEVGASKLFSKLKNIHGKGNLTSNCRSLAYRLYNHCEKNKKPDEARSYNSLIISWPELEKISADKINESKIQTNLF